MPVAFLLIHTVQGSTAAKEVGQFVGIFDIPLIYFLQWQIYLL